ncbi:lipase member H-like [Venturia canescens]|uniref:lipase member H-like n=1 Tax=Venturia canescens TaxID=32260 RepID=UPI001C9C7B6A|nr:lipase member H-like [Venturia canescens]
MKWLRYSVVRLALLAYSFSYVNTATREQLGSIFLRLYNGRNTEDYVDADIHEAETLTLDLNVDKPMVVYVHGFTESVNSTSVQTIVEAYLNRSDHNILVVDWNIIARENYIQVATNVESVGTTVAKALNDIVHGGFPAKNIHVVGHSMGAHVSAYVGRNVDFPLQRITGLDPAGPLFNFIGRHLSYADAQFVDIIHTDAGFYGITRITGTVDFFPNKGRRIQPGCPTAFTPYSEEDFCSHHRSWIFYSESLISEKAFLAVKCSNLMRKRRSSPALVMGYAVPKDAKGSYCLVTSPSAPYGLGEAGARETYL